MQTYKCSQIYLHTYPFGWNKDIFTGKVMDHRAIMETILTYKYKFSVNTSSIPIFL